jgi:hypothetical protein
MRIFYKTFYIVFCDLMSILQNLIPEVIPSHKSHINIGPILSGWGGQYIWNLKWFATCVIHGGQSCVSQQRKFDYVLVVPLFCLICVHILFHVIPYIKIHDDWCPVTSVTSTTEHHDQSIGSGSAHSGTQLCVDWNVGCPVMLEIHL